MDKKYHEIVEIGGRELVLEYEYEDVYNLLHNRESGFWGSDQILVGVVDESESRVWGFQLNKRTKERVAPLVVMKDSISAIMRATDSSREANETLRREMELEHDG